MQFMSSMMKEKDIDRSHTAVVLVGAGGHARSLMEIPGINVSGYISNEKTDGLDLIYYGDDRIAGELANQGKYFHIAYVYSGLPQMTKRLHIIEKYKNSGATFATIIAPTAIVTSGSRIGDGCAIMQGAIINRAFLGENSIVNTGAIIEHDTKIGANTFIGPGAVIGGGVTIGDNCFIGLGAKIRNGITIGPDVSVAMGAIVNCDLLEPGIYHGNPLRLHNPNRH